MKDGILDFSLPSLISTAARCPWHIQTFDHDFARILVQCHYHCLLRFFGTSFLWQGQDFVCFNQEKKLDQILIGKNERIKMNWIWCIWLKHCLFSIVISLENISVVRFSIVPSRLKLDLYREIFQMNMAKINYAWQKVVTVIVRVIHAFLWR